MIEIKYKNSWYVPGSKAPEYYTIRGERIEYVLYHGYKMYLRIPSSKPSRRCWDVVIDGTCVAQRCGLTGCYDFVNEILKSATAK